MRRLFKVLLATGLAGLLASTGLPAVASAAGTPAASVRVSSCGEAVIAEPVPAPDAPPPSEPLVPITTGVRHQHHIGIQVGSQFEPMALTGHFCPALQVVSVDRANTAVKSNTTYVCNNAHFPLIPMICPEALHRLAETLTRADPNTLIVAQSDSSVFSQLFEAYLRGIGVQESRSQIPGAKTVTALGVPGTPVGQGQQSLVMASTGVPVRGYLYASVVPEVSHDLYAYIQSEYPVIDTRAAGSGARDNAITVTGATYRAGLPPNHLFASGYHVVVLDRETLRLEVNEVYTQPETLNSALSRVGPNELAIISSIGSPPDVHGPAAGQWDAVARQIARLGGTTQPFLSQQTPYGYSLIGVAGKRVATSPESSTAADGPSGGRLHVVLVRDHLQRFGVDLSDVSGSQTFDLYRQALAAPTAWPVTTTEERRKAYVALSRIGVGDSDIRRAYWSRPRVSWSEARSDIEGAHYQPNAGYSEADFEAVKQELATEISKVIQVNTFFAGDEAVLDKGYLGHGTLLQDVSNQVQKLFGVPASTNVVFDIFSMFSSMLLIGHMFTAPTGPKLLGRLAAISSLGIATARTFLGTPQPDQFPTQVSTLGAAVLDRYKEALTGIDQVRGWIVGDWGRLSTMQALMSCDAPGQTAAECRAWQPTGNDDIRVANALTEGLQQSMYEQLVGYKIHAYRLPSKQGNRDIRQPSSYVCGFPIARPPFGSAPAWSWTLFANDSLSSHVFVATFRGAGRYYPSQAAMDKLFGPQNTGKPLDGALGLYPPYFYLRALEVTPQSADC